MAIGAGIAGIQQLHGPQVDFPAFQGHRHEVADTQALGRGGRQALMDEGIDHFVFQPQDLGVVWICANPIDAE
jgi:hypothetical protein